MFTFTSNNYVRNHYATFVEFRENGNMIPNCFTIMLTNYLSTFDFQTWTFQSLKKRVLLLYVCLFSHACGGLNKNGLHWLTGGGNIRRNGLVGVNVALLEEMNYWRAGFEISEAQARPTVSHLLLLPPADPDVEFSAPQHHVFLNTTMLPVMTTME